MTTLVLEAEPIISNVIFENDKFIVELADGRTLSVPLDWYPRLAAALPTERMNWLLLGEGFGIEWPNIDEFISIEGLLAGRRSGESQRSFERWLDGRK